LQAHRNNAASIQYNTCSEFNAQNNNTISAMLAWTQRQMESALTRVQKWQTVAKQTCQD